MTKFAALKSTACNIISKKSNLNGKSISQKQNFQSRNTSNNRNIMYWICFLSSGADLHVGHPLGYIADIVAVQKIERIQRIASHGI